MFQQMSWGSHRSQSW